MRARTTLLIGFMILGTGALQAQPEADRAIEQYECRDVMRETNDRDVSLAFLHGYLLGKSGSSKFNLNALRQRSQAFLEECLLKPQAKAVDVMTAIGK
jgi:hypothetical protein